MKNEIRDPKVYMDASSPLILPLGKSETPKLNQHHPSLDEVLEQCIGEFGWTQLLQVILVSFACVFDSQQIFISIFSDTKPTWHCTPLSGESCNSLMNVCKLRRSLWDWDSPMHTSIISEWYLECASPIITGLPASSFFTGSLVGGLLLGTLADSSLGRKNLLIVSCFLMSVFGLLTGVSTNIWVYSTFRFLSGFGRGTVGTCALVLSSELVGKRWRGEVGIIGFLCFSVGFISLPAIAYLNKGYSWRVLYFWTCIPAILYCALVHFFVQESPRWIFLRGNKEAFVTSIIKHKDSNQRLLDIPFIEKESQNVDFYSSIKMLVSRTWILQRLIVVMVVSFGIGMVYYGMPLGVGVLAFNLYLSVTFNALSELFSTLITIFVIKRLDRKSALLGLTILSGTCSIICVVTRGDRWKKIQIVMELVSFSSACMGFNFMLIYAIELFPTCVRNSAVSMARLAVGLGGVFSPVILAIGGENGLLSYGVFGVTIGFCGLFVTFLPETRGCALCDTMEEEDNKQMAISPLPDNIGVHDV